MIGREYHKIQTVWLRDPDTNFKTLLQGQDSKPEFTYLRDLDWWWTEKVDGTNVRIGLRTAVDGTDEVAGKTDNATLHPHLVARCKEIAARATADTLVGLTLFGEGFGAGIQKGGGNYSATKDFVLFDVWSDAGQMWLERNNVEDIGTQLGISVVPVVGYGSLGQAIELVRSGPNSTWGFFKAEGLVMRPAVELRNRRGERVITKLKHKDFAPLTPESGSATEV